MMQREMSSTQFMSARSVHIKLSIFLNLLLQSYRLLYRQGLLRTFEISHSAIARAKLRGYDDPPRRGQPGELDAESEQGLIAWIVDKAVNNTAVNKTELLHECNERFRKTITRG
jgi:hypothetical protein